MIQVCYCKGCGVVYGEKEPLSDKRETHGLCQKHLKVAQEEMRAELEKLEHRSERSKVLKVLIVEDSALFRQILKDTLYDRFPSIEIHEATDGEEAFQKIEASRPALIFMDIRLPGENGLELTKKVKARYPNTIVAILTAYDLPEYREFSRQYADHFLSKDSSSTTKNIFRLVQSILPIPA